MEFPDLNQLFTGFTQRESLIFLAFCLVAFLFGLLIGYVLRGRRVRALRRELKKKEAEIQQRDEKIQQLTEELSLKEADLKKAINQQQEATERAQRLQIEHGKLNNQVIYLRDELEKERANTDSYQSTIDDLNDQILGLKTKLGQQNAGLSATDATGNGNNDLQNRLAAVESRLQVVEKENSRLEATITELQEQKVKYGSAVPVTEPDPEEPDLPQKSEQHVLDHDRARMQHMEKDDLTRIEGVGPFLEKKLNDAGVFSYQQIAEWKEEDIDRITAAIQFFEGRIEKDNWVGQARRLQNLKQDNPEAPAEETSGTTPTLVDNLRIIEGIGPVIEAILQEQGIRSFSDLAQADPADLRKWLQAKDPNLAMHDPDTWPAQARLAAAEQWDVLKDYQDQLRGGKRD